MQTVIRVIVTLFFLGLIILGIVFFSIVAVVPKEKLARIKSGDLKAATSTVQVTTEVPQGFFDKYFLTPLQAVFTPKETTQQPVPEEITVKSTEPVTAPGPVEAPKQSSPVAPSQIPRGVITLVVSSAGFSPNSFTVNAGADVAVALEASDAFSHVMMFDDASLSQVVIGASPQGSGARIIAFKAPAQPGTYVFRCGIPGHADRGEVGRMIVK